jgi:putative endonuclease
VLPLTRRQRDGRRAEALAQRYLRRRGLADVARNVHCRHGEIDLVMRDGDTLVFVEVRYRRDGAFGRGSDSVTVAKQRRLARHPRWMNHPCRFDVISIDGPLDEAAVDWIRNAIPE